MERNGCDKLNVPFRYFCAQTEKTHENVSDDQSVGRHVKIWTQDILKQGYWDIRYKRERDSLVQ